MQHQSQSQSQSQRAALPIHARRNVLMEMELSIECHFVTFSLFFNICLCFYEVDIVFRIVRLSNKTPPSKASSMVFSFIAVRSFFCRNAIHSYFE
jgi:hypothetical protein